MRKKSSILKLNGQNLFYVVLKLVSLKKNKDVINNLENHCLLKTDDLLSICQTYLTPIISMALFNNF